LADAAAFFIDSQWPLPMTVLALACGLFLAGVIALAFGALRRKSFSASEGLGLAILLFWLLLFFAAVPVLLPDRAHQIAAALGQIKSGSPKSVLLVGDLKLASRLRILLGKNWTVVQTDKLNPAATKNFMMILLPERATYQLFNRGWQMQVAAVSNGTPPCRELWHSLIERRLPEAFLRYEERFCLAVRG
jgi:hypothetical protein